VGRIPVWGEAAVSEGMACANVSLGRTAVALGVSVSVAGVELSTVIASPVSVGTTVVNGWVLVGEEDVGRGVFPVADVFVAGGLVWVGAAVVGRCVGDGPAVGTVWKGGAPQDWRIGTTRPRVSAASMTMNSFRLEFTPAPA
jgi:hypothetical protein